MLDVMWGKTATHGEHQQTTVTIVKALYIINYLSSDGNMNELYMYAIAKESVEQF